MDKAKKDIRHEMEKVRDLVKKRIIENVPFPLFCISYSQSSGYRMVQPETWKDDYEKKATLTALVNWLKDMHPYLFVFTSTVKKQKFSSKEDFEKGTNSKESPAVLIVGKTPEQTLHLSITHKETDKKIVFEEKWVDMSNSEHTNFLDDIYANIN